MCSVVFVLLCLEVLIIQSSRCPHRLDAIRFWVQFLGLPSPPEKSKENKIAQTNEQTKLQELNFLCRENHCCGLERHESGAQVMPGNS